MKRISLNYMDGVLHIADSNQYQACKYVDDGSADGEYQRMKSALLAILDSDELTDRQRDTLRLRYIDGLRLADIAETIGVSIPTVSKHIAKACRRVQQIMTLTFPRLRQDYTQPARSKATRGVARQGELSILGLATGAHA